jgi:hypothetical protein
VRFAHTPPGRRSTPALDVYFRASQLPGLSSVSYVEHLRILLAAARAHNPWLFARIGLIFVLMLMSTTAVNFLPASLGLPAWSGAAVGMLYGGVFYIFLLWELNGPLGIAVARYLPTSERDASLL